MNKYPMIVGQCQECAGKIIAKSSSFVKPNRKFCSLSCKTSSNNKSRVWTKTAREKASKNASKRFKGVKKSISTRLKFRSANLGNKSHFWQGGLTSEDMKMRNSCFTTMWRERVLNRDNYTCSRCKKKGNNMEAHHVKSWKDFPDLRWVDSNGVSLCEKCHYKTHGELRRIKV